MRYRPPAEGAENGATVRNDTGVYEGGEISIYYDPMIAKLCTHAADRTHAIDAMARALDGFYIEGIRHNVPFLAAIMENPRWRSGELSTGFIAEEFPQGFSGRALDPELSQLLASVAAALDHTDNLRKRHIDGQLRGKPVKFSPRRVVRLGDLWIPLEVSGDAASQITTRQDGAKPQELRAKWHPGEPVWSGDINGRPVKVQVQRILNGYRLHHRGASVEAYVYTEREAALARLMPAASSAGTSNKLLCPMPGLVVSIAVKEGQEVKAGEPLAVVEAMKMQNILRAERDGAVKAVHAKVGDSLAVDAVIMEFA